MALDVAHQMMREFGMTDPSDTAAVAMASAAKTPGDVASQMALAVSESFLRSNAIDRIELEKRLQRYMSKLDRLPVVTDRQAGTITITAEHSNVAVFSPGSRQKIETTVKANDENSLRGALALLDVPSKLVDELVKIAKGSSTDAEISSLSDPKSKVGTVVVRVAKQIALHSAEFTVATASILVGQMLMSYWGLIPA